MEGQLVVKQITIIYVKRELLSYLARVTKDARSCLLSVLVESWGTPLKVIGAALAHPVIDFSLTVGSNLVFCSLLQPRKEIRTRHVRLSSRSDALGPLSRLHAAPLLHIVSELDAPTEKPAHLRMSS